MKFRIVAAIAAIACSAAPLAAAPIYDFSSSGNVASLGASATLAGGITGSAWYLDGTWKPSLLVARGETGDHGLGVCSESPQSPCNIGGTGGGDYNELSQLQYNEGILLQRPANTFWTGLWLSSLDNNDGNTSQGAENGILYWGSSPDVQMLINGGHSLTFSYPEFLGGAAEGQLPLGSLDVSAMYLLFLPGGNVGENNDYLVWGANLGTRERDLPPPVPEPASLLLLGSGLAMLGYRRRR